jgi:hypothetical protein
MNRSDPRFGPLLPPVYRGSPEHGGRSTMDRFLQAFEDVYAEIVGEIEAVPSLLSLTPTPSLEKEAKDGDAEIWLDTASGIHPGDWLLIDGQSVAFVQVAEVAAAPQQYRGLALAPQVRPNAPQSQAPGLASQIDPEIQSLLPPVRVRLAGEKLSRGYAVRTPVRMVGRVAAETSLLTPGPPGQTRLQVTPFAEGLPAPGDVLELAAPPGAPDSEPEWLKVLSAPSPYEVTFAPALRRSYPPGWTLRLRPAPPVTNPATDAYPYAERGGAQLVLSAGVGAGESTLELDTLQGIEPGDQILIWDRNPDAVEFVTVSEVRIPSEAQNLTVAGDDGPILRRGALLSGELRSAHELGTALHVLGADGQDTFLTEAVTPGSAVIRVAEPERLDVRPGHVLRLECTDECATTEEPELALVMAVSGNDVTLSRPVGHAHSAGARVVRVHLAGSGTAHLAELGGWIGVHLRPGRGERWQREWLRRAAALWRYRGTRIGFEGLLTAYLRNEALVTVYDLSNPMQVGLVSTIGVDTAVGGGIPYHYFARLHMDPYRITSYNADGLSRLLAESSTLIRNETPAHTHCDLVLHANTMRIGKSPDKQVGVRVGVTTLIWEKPLPVRTDRQDRGMRG